MKDRSFPNGWSPAYFSHMGSGVLQRTTEPYLNCNLRIKKRQGASQLEYIESRLGSGNRMVRGQLFYLGEINGQRLPSS